MAAGVQLPGGGETIDLQQQVARLQALLEASRQVHSTIHENEVLEQVLRIVVRELEMARRGLSLRRPGLWRRSGRCHGSSERLAARLASRGPRRQAA